MTTECGSRVPLEYCGPSRSREGGTPARGYEDEGQGDDPGGSSRSSGHGDGRSQMAVMTALAIRPP